MPDDPAYPIKITIADDGPGIHRQHFDQVFALGFTTRRQEGTGLGLYITRGLVESMGGRISIAESLILVGYHLLDRATADRQGDIRWVSVRLRS